MSNEYPSDSSFGIPEDQQYEHPAESSSTLQHSSEIHLRVGEREFWTSKTTLTGGSTYFASMLSGNWTETEHEHHNAIFIDSDPDIFTHILRFLRTGVFPIFWNRTMGFDFPLYVQLLREAQYFGVQSLAEWILRKQYLQTVKVQYFTKEVGGPPESSDMPEYSDVLTGDIERTYHPQWRTEKRYRCPRNIYIHNGSPDRCGRACEKAKLEGQSNYEDAEVMRTLICETKVVFNNDACLVERVAMAPPSTGGEDELL